MAVAFVQDLGAVGSSSSSNTLALTLGASTTVGNHLIMLAISGGQNLTSVADSKGNTWQKDRAIDGVDPRSGFFSCKITTQLVSTDTITLTVAGSTASRAFRVLEFSGLHTTAWFDATGTNGGNGASGSAGTSANSGATATLPQADMVVVGVVGHVSTVGSFAFQSLSPAWVHEGSIASTGTVRTCQPGYRLPNATTAVSTQATWTTSRNWSACVGAYIGAAAVAANKHRVGLLGVGR
jgi:hypothetical protein